MVARMKGDFVEVDNACLSHNHRPFKKDGALLLKPSALHEADSAMLISMHRGKAKRSAIEGKAIELLQERFKTKVMVRNRLDFMFQNVTYVP